MILSACGQTPARATDRARSAFSGSSSKFLYAFHEEEKIEQAKQQRLPDQIAYIPTESEALEGLGKVNQDLIRRLGERCPEQKIATVDQGHHDYESRKQEALHTYEGPRGYQPMLAVWAEMDAVLADEFRRWERTGTDGSVDVAKAAFAALPKTVTSYYYRGDAACHEKSCCGWLSNEKREEGPRDALVLRSAVRRASFARGHSGSSGKGMEAYGEPEPGIDRECAEVVFVSNQQAEPKDSQPLRYIAIRLRQRQGGLFADGSSVRHFGRAEQPLGLGTGETDRVASRKSRDHRTGTRCDEE